MTLIVIQSINQFLGLLRFVELINEVLHGLLMSLVEQFFRVALLDIVFFSKFFLQLAFLAWVITKPVHLLRGAHISIPVQSSVQNAPCSL